MLKLKNVYKVYENGKTKVDALRDINLEFSDSDFVSILGQSGSGKTTLLNLIGGLDRYTSGDLLIDGRSTKDFKDGDWDSYRNGTVGFVFQNYNLIPHLSVFGNVEMALALSGVSISERRRRAIGALKSVGLGDQMHKNPNELSGGQMQRVAIARALVNNPKIILADEPTGALDSATSVQIMNILKEISRDRLIIMVTHNEEIAEEYSTRIVRLVDGKVSDDSRPLRSVKEENLVKFVPERRSAMSFLTALRLSFNNLKTKFARTIITSFAGSIGIIGIATVLAITNGMTIYINQMQSDALSVYPLAITQVTRINTPGLLEFRKDTKDRFPSEDKIVPYDSSQLTENDHLNILTKEFLAYADSIDPSLYNAISYNYAISMNLIALTDTGAYQKINTANAGFQQLARSKDFIMTQYDVLAGRYPEENGEALLVIDDQNRVNVNLLKTFGISYTLGTNLTFEDFLDHEFKILFNDDFYKRDNSGKFVAAGSYKELYNKETAKTMTVTAVLRIKRNATNGVLSRGIGYLPTLTDELLEKNGNSQIVWAQLFSPKKSVLDGSAINEIQLKSIITALGGSPIPVSVFIYPKSFDAKDEIKTYLDSYNSFKPDEEKVLYTDAAETIMKAVSTLIKTISAVLSGLAAISLVVSSIMIGIITYVSVVERTKEIGVLRSLGARKKDIGRVFNAETVIIGFSAGVMGVALSLVLSFPINSIIFNMTEVPNISRLPVLAAFVLIGVSMLLTFISGLIPSSIAAKKDPVKALRTE
jgi:ABC-type antimicrobial peptide transport system, ATPase component